MSSGEGVAAGRPVRVALMNDYEVVVSGLQTMLAPYADRVRVVELDSMLPVHTPVDVVLFDAYGRQRVSTMVAQTISETDAKVVVYAWHLPPRMVEEALAAGAAACLTKTLEAVDLVAAIEKVHGGSVIVSDDPGPDAGADATSAAGDWPGREHGLSARESEVLALIAQGLSNQEIAEGAFLSINSVKTYIRSAYRKIGVKRRTQAVIWATQHGFVPNKSRVILGDP
jgi:DNA-binding NarL/FixJ family response regulator